MPKTESVPQTDEKPQTSVNPYQTNKQMQLSATNPDPITNMPGVQKGTNGIPGTPGTPRTPVIPGASGNFGFISPLQSPTNNLKCSPTKVHILHRGQMTGGLPPQQSVPMQLTGGTVQFSELKARLTQPLKSSGGEATSAKRPKTIGEKLDDFKKAEERHFPECSMCNRRHEPSSTECQGSPQTANVIPDIIRFYTG